MALPKEVREARVVVQTWRTRISGADTGLHPENIRCHLVSTTSTTTRLFVDRGTTFTEVVLRRREGMVQVRGTHIKIGHYMHRKRITNTLLSTV